MNLKNYLSIVLMLFALTAIGQTKPNGCGTHLSQEDEVKFKQAMLKMKAQKQFGKKTALINYKIPVIFHVLNNGQYDEYYDAVTRSDMECRINDAIEVVNKDFRGEFPGYNTTDPRFDAVKSKMDNVEFILAKEDPDGNLLEFPGMNWQADSDLVAKGYDPKITENKWWWGKNGKYYLQVFVVSSPNGPEQGTGASGHAFLPVQAAFPRVVYNWKYIGTSSSCAPNSPQGGPGFEKVMSHEFGHYFGLKHTFNGSSDKEKEISTWTWTVENDGIDDTPPTMGTEGCTRDVLNFCGVFPNLENHMDYNTSCQNMFTVDQVAVMNMWFEDTSVAPYPRSLLWQPANLIATGITPRVPTAKFSSNTTGICSTKSIIFKDVSTGIPDSRIWTFEGGTPASSTEKNPTVTYANTGQFKVTLQVTNVSGSNTTFTEDYIDVNQYSTTNITEDFQGTFPSKGWTVINPDGKLAWEKRNDVGNGDSSCIIMNNADNAVTGEEDYLQLPLYDFTDATKAQMYFDVAYVKFNADSPDMLKVDVSTDCGTTWNEIYSKTHLELETTISALSPNDWIPNEESHWRKEVIDLSAYDGNSNLTFRFKNVSGYGTRVWIDNISISLKNDIAPETAFYTKTRVSLCTSETVAFFDTSNATPTSWAWEFPGGTPATSNLQNPVVDYNGAGSYDVTLTATNVYGNKTVSETAFVVLKTPKLDSFTEDFSGVFPPADWTINNFDGKLEFEQASAGNGDNFCMIMNNADNSVIGELDEILLPSLNLSVGATDFYFDVAYTKYDDDSPDKLSVMASKDCGVTWTTLYEKTHIVLETVEVLDDPATVDNNEANDWVPSLPEHWRKERVILTDYQGESNVLVKFVNESGYGTRIWIDNVSITTNSQEAPTSDFEKQDTGVCLGSSIQFTDASTGIPTSWNWAFEEGIPAVSTEQNPLITYNKPGVYQVTLTASNGFGTGTTTTKTGYVTVKGKTSLPYIEDFSGDFPITDWEIINPDNDAILWEKRTDAGNGDSSCIIINNADNPTGKIDELILKPFDFSVTGDKKMEFDIAYTKFTNSFDLDADAPDNLIILVSTNCGATWTDVYNKMHTELETVQVVDIDGTDENEANDFVPSQASHWRTESIDLTAYDGESNVLVKFKNISGYGTRIWIDNLKISSTPDSESITWTGTTDTDWDTASNWNTNTVPTTTSDITIPAGLTNYPTASSAITFNSLTINSGASFIPQGTVTGTVTYKRNIPDTNWHLIAFPVSGTTYEGLITNHTFATGSATNIGIGAYSNVTGAPWIYSQLSETGELTSGFGLSIKLAASDEFSFTGTANTSNINHAITTGTRTNFNLVGNPFTSYVNAATFVTANTSLLSEETIWLWNGSEYVTYNATNSIEIAPGQGFIVEAASNGDVTFATSNQSHQTDTFKRPATKTSFELFAENKTSKKSTKVFYITDKTTGFDNGYDSKMFTDVKSDFDVFTELITDNKGNKLAIQSLPNTDLETIVVPVGITAKAGEEVTFSVNSQNLPSDVKIYLEDRIANTFTDISETSHKVVLENAANSTGQFYIHTTSKDLEIAPIQQELQNVSIYKSANNSITITGLQTENASLNVFSVLGQKIISKSFKSNGSSIIQLPKTSTGVYIIELNSDLGTINKKIILE